MNEIAERRIKQERDIIEQKKKEMKNAGKIHAADLRLEINRREKELKIYIGYQRKAASVSA